MQQVLRRKSNVRRLLLPLLLLGLAPALVFPTGCTGPVAVEPKAEDASFVWFRDTVLQSDKVVLVEFSATWCRPCQLLKPHLHELEKVYGDRLKVIVVDIDEHPGLQDRFRVSGVPHLMLFSNGEILSNPGPGAPPTYALLEGLVKPWLKDQAPAASEAVESRPS